MGGAIERFSVRAAGGRPAAFAIDGPSGAELASEFVVWLAERERSPYTQRTYGFGIAHFFGWLRRADIDVSAVDGTVVRRYVGAFRAGDEAMPLGRAPRTVNHRLSVLWSFFEFLADVDQAEGRPARENPVPVGVSPMASNRSVPGRDPPRHGRRAELRARVPRRVRRGIEPEVAVALIAAARSWRDRALLTLLWRCGQRIGDWSQVNGRHGVLGLSLGDLDRGTGTIVVRLKGARDEHRVPVADDFWPLYAGYVREERGLGEPHDPAWVALRRGRGRPLGYATFESQLRALSARIGVRVTAHMFRHALAQALVDVAGVKAAQEILGHAHMSTTESSYARVDEQAMVRALSRANDLLDLRARDAAEPHRSPAGGYAFRYDAATTSELDRLCRQPRDPRGGA